jgi:nitroimidazol reductase NimA-like FMN-containing flavoprotein (pyridoxamine 5'-phosphate oxidase superfamily)
VRRSEFEIIDKKLIEDILQKIEYATLALCKDNIPYSVPINYIYKDEMFYFHGSKKGKKMEHINSNPNASLSIVEPYSMIQSYFSSTDDLACPATQFFKSIIIQGKIETIQDNSEKVMALESLMKKLQPEGKYKQLNDEAYNKIITATEVFKLIPSDIKGKVKLGQHLSKDRFDLVLKHLENRGSDIDKITIKEMKKCLH